MGFSFYNHSNPQWAFDAYDESYAASTRITSEYELLGNYYVPWKLIPEGKSGKITARIVSGNVDPDSVVFRTPAGTEYFAEYNGSEFELTLIGSQHGDAQEIYALYPQGDSNYMSLGKLKAASYNLLHKSLALVPIGEASLAADAIKDQMDAIYLPYGIEWEVRSEAPFTDMSWAGEDGKLDAGDSEFFTAYTSEMRALNGAFKNSRSVQDDEVYLFIFDTPAANSETGLLLGDMPIGYQFGYVFSPTTEPITAKTIAHELGHGRFQLTHTFDSYYGLSKGASTNLMDYSQGTELVKQQCDVIYDPQILLAGFLQSDEAGAFEDGVSSMELAVLERIFDDHLKYNEQFSLASLWDITSVDNLIYEIVNPEIKNLFYIKEGYEGGYVFNLDSYLVSIGESRESIDPSDDVIKQEKDKAESLSEYVIAELEDVFLREERLSNDEINGFKQRLVNYCYHKIIQNGVQERNYTWIDGSRNSFIDPRTYFRNGIYDFVFFESDIKEYLLLRNPELKSIFNSEVVANKRNNYYMYLSMYGEYMYRIGVDELLESEEVSNQLKQRFYSYWELTGIEQLGYTVRWKTLRDARWEERREEWLAMLRGDQALSLYLQAIEEGRVQAVKDIVIGGAGTVVSGIIIGTSEFTLGTDLFLGLLGMGYSIDAITGGINTINTINNEVFDPNVEYRLVKGMIVDNYGETGAVIYNIGELLVHLNSISGILRGDKVNTVIDYIGAGISTEQIIEYVNENIQ